MVTITTFLPPAGEIIVAANWSSKLFNEAGSLLAEIKMTACLPRLCKSSEVHYLYPKWWVEWLAVAGVARPVLCVVTVTVCMATHVEAA